MQPVWLCIHWCRQFGETFENAQWRKVKQMQPMWLCIFTGRQFEGTFENAQRRKVKQMQPMWLCILLCTPFEGTFENTQRRKTKQMQPVWLCIPSGCRPAIWRHIWKLTLEKSQMNAARVTLPVLIKARSVNIWDAQWRKVKQMQSMWLCIISSWRFEETFVNTH